MPKPMPIYEIKISSNYRVEVGPKHNPGNLHWQWNLMLRLNHLYLCVIFVR